MSQTTLTDISSKRICFFGAGSMAEAIARGLIHEKLVEPAMISMLNRSNETRLTELNERYGVQTIKQGSTNEEYLREADIIFLAMKPKDAVEAIAGLAPLLHTKQLIISVIAGLSISSMERLLSVEQPIVRSMPNTSSTIGLGATGISYSSSVDAEQRLVTEVMFKSIGVNAIVDESLQTSITGVSGSGPAYVYFVMEAMLKAADELGLEPHMARELVVQTVLGAAEMVRVTGEAPEELRRKVTSPNGTTQAALELMAQGGLPEAIIKGMHRSATRAAEIGADMEGSIMK
ncbi:pyrroline-5-carboxylate reductase [Paenibacillus sp. GSMTC-2017]|uniref:pyrroline-5-carboxylate reductase n=1 Tax=Paenibacillus sp. GSMTC-2017 TaxID=2794350 RepID=UPI0018D803DA|nr:pyrroline-5-carboxylate reductase [Paenibacillus sp. GSMTC-2017]MBH5317905.1 pyrroline-5-carboxylate reductase [Paenibacillus sp. GSMTC-2017]